MIQRAFNYVVHTKNVQICEKFVILFDRFRNMILITLCIVLFQIERLKIWKKQSTTLCAYASAIRKRIIWNAFVTIAFYQIKLLQNFLTQIKKTKREKYFWYVNSSSHSFKKILIIYRRSISAIVLLHDESWFEKCWYRSEKIQKKNIQSQWKIRSNEYFIVFFILSNV